MRPRLSILTRSASEALTGHPACQAPVLGILTTNRCVFPPEVLVESGPWQAPEVIDTNPKRQRGPDWPSRVPGTCVGDFDDPHRQGAWPLCASGGPCVLCFLWVLRAETNQRIGQRKVQYSFA